MFELQTGFYKMTTDPICSSEYYEFLINGHIGSQWSEWFDGLTITNLQDGRTLISGCVADQAALHGLIARIRDLNLELIQLTRK